MGTCWIQGDWFLNIGRYPVTPDNSAKGSDDDLLCSQRPQKGIELLVSLPLYWQSLLLFRDSGDDPLINICFDFVPVVIAHVGDGLSLVAVQDGLRACGHRGQLILVRHVVGHFMLDNPCMLIIDGHLQIVTDICAWSGLHRPASGIGEGDLGCSAVFKLLQQVFIALLAR